MISRIQRCFFTITVTAPIFFSLGLIGIIKSPKIYSQGWYHLFCERQIPCNFEWWSINLSLLFMLISIIGIGMFLHSINKMVDAKTITVDTYENMSQIGTDQVVSSIIPWLTLFADDLNFKVLFFCIILQCGFMVIASYNNNNYNFICSLLGYRYYQVKTEENTFIFISKKCIRNRKEIRKYIPLTDYTGIIIKDN